MKEAGAVIVDPVSTGIDLFPLLEDTRTNYYEAQFSYDLYFRRLGPDAVIHDMDELIAKGGELVKPSIVRGVKEFDSLTHHPDFLARRDTQETLKAAVIELMDKYRLDALVHPFKSLPPERHLDENVAREGQPAQLRHGPAGVARAGRLHARRERADRARDPRPAVLGADAVQARVRLRAGIAEPQARADDAAACPASGSSTDARQRAHAHDAPTVARRRALARSRRSRPERSTLAWAAAPREFALASATIADMQAAMDAGALTAERLVQLYLNRIAAYDQQGPALNSLIAVNARGARDSARARPRARGDRPAQSAARHPDRREGSREHGRRADDGRVHRDERRRAGPRRARHREARARPARSCSRRPT